LLLENSRKMAAAGRSHHGYSYGVPNQWQGRFEQLQVLGDKKGAASAWRLYLNPDFLEFVRNRIAIDLKFVHVIRNPYDVLATMSHRSPRKPLDTHIDVFFQLCSGIERLKKPSQGLQIYDVRLESFIGDPSLNLKIFAPSSVSKRNVVTWKTVRVSFLSPPKKVVLILTGAAGRSLKCASACKHSLFCPATITMKKTPLPKALRHRA
jgi:hypothetical protein